MAGRLQGKTAIVTGGASGFGKGIATKFIAEGANVIITDLNEEQGQTVASELSCLFSRADVTNPDDWRRVLDFSLDKFKQLDIVVNNAGAAYSNKPTETVTASDFDLVMNVNVKSLYHSTNVLLPYFLKENKPGCFIQVASTAGSRPRLGLTWYNASKAAVINATKTMAVEYGPKQIRFNSISPVVGSTGMTHLFIGKPDTEENRKGFVSTIPMGRPSTPSDIANACCYLASDEAGFITGVDLESNNNVYGHASVISRQQLDNMSDKYDSMANPHPLPFKLKNDYLLNYSSFINGEFVPAKEGKTFDVIDPGSGKVWASCPDCTASDVNAAVESSHNAFKNYSKTTPRYRAQIIMKWYNLILEAREDLATILVHETGKPWAEACGEIDYALTFVWWFSGEADRGAHGTSLTCALPGRRAMTIKQPIGVAAALVPWNFPIALSLRKAAAALAAGCTMVVKPSPETPLTTVSIAHLALKAGVPPGALNVLTTSLDNTPPVAEALCLHPLVKKVSFTGSTRVGKIIARLCAQNLKKTTFELGGNCPFIVFEDANIDQAMNQLMPLKWRHAGQACITSNRVFVQSSIYDSFVDRLVSETRKLKVGHGMEEGTTIGALTTPRGLDKGEELYKDAISKGAKTILGTGKREEREGYFMAPTILVDMKDEMLMTHDEIFAPLLGVYRFESEDEVIQRANDTPLGLASYVFTKNVDRLWRMFENLEAGMIGLNSGNSSSAEAPFGGIKDSGHGKESGKDVAIDEFLITKTGTITIEG
ncbi:hypothetical protein FSARC_10881 [Fusarium sarcochroum]|uniref:Aldehyde dehydrogenase domain-containing protein n=1 Tax=Fusarium sarcochroum TaxID=1208366 RepID=A0A8H4TJ43_9HYPO|nr:hypothetical protein FSARC_10881 [Fusarium sarcochroum]